MAESNGQLIEFGKLRTVFVSREQIIDKQGRARDVREILPLLESEFARRDFRIFVGAVPPVTDIERLTRETRAHLLVMLDAKSELVNSSGMFSKYRASVDARAIRARDGTLLAVVRDERMGERSQEGDRGGILALRAIAPSVATNLVEELVRKSDQLLWAGLVVSAVPSYERALQIQQAIEREKLASYVELLEWNKATQTAYYEIMYSTLHESDIGLLMQRIPGMKIRVTRYEPGEPEARKKFLMHYK